MPRAYVAKPRAVSVPDLPPGWSPIWPHPGPSPPGYEPSLGVVVTGGASVGLDTGHVTQRATLRDHTDYPTNEPTSGARVTWSAVCGSSMVPIGLAGGSLGDAVETGYSQDGDGFWYSEPTLEFDVTDLEEGDVITLTAEARLNPVLAASASVDLSVEAAVTYSVTGDSGQTTFASYSVYTWMGPCWNTPYGAPDYSDDPGAYPVSGEPPPAPVSTPDSGGTITLTPTGGTGGAEQTVEADAEGHFVFDDVPPGSYSVSGAYLTEPVTVDGGDVSVSLWEIVEGEVTEVPWTSCGPWGG